MRYYRYDLWLRINDADARKRQEAAALWNSSDQAYRRRFERLKPMLPADFLAVYEEERRFLNWRIESILVHPGTTGPDFPWHIELTISHDDHRLVLVYDHVRSVVFTAAPRRDDNLLSPRAAPEHWGYDEFSTSREGLMIHELLFDTGSGVRITAQNLRLTQPART